jgi:alanine or glycine:cation symporter, AGCS family
MTLKDFFLQLNQNFTFFFVFPSIVILGFYLSFKMNFLQITKLKLSGSSLLKKDESEHGNISHYQAISAVIAGNLGTGNISGMAVALATGGPGSLVWMWVMAFLGSIIQYSSCFLGVKYRQKDENGEFVGGPMYYLHHGLGLKKLAVIFAFVTMIAAVTVGNFAQINSIVLPLKSFGFNPLLCGFGMMIIAALAILGGIQRIAKIASSIVPVMALLYLGAGCCILFFFRHEILPSLWLMLQCAFQGTSFFGGVLGFGVVKALTTGFERGVFATDAGTGIVPILQAGARTKSPVVDGIVTLIAPFIVMVVCTMTGLILIATGAFEQSGLQSTNMVIYAFQQVFGSQVGNLLVIVALALFAYTTVIAWGGCGEKAAQFLWGKKRSRFFQYIYLALIPIGAVAHVELVWILADLSIAFMLVTNLIGIAGLSKEVIVESKRYFQAEDHPISELPLEDS